MNEFLWAVSTSAFQVEGASTEDGKGLTTADTRCERKGHGETVKTASDSYHHVEEDVALLKELGVKAYRFSISWARIYPNGNDEDINEAGLAYYRKLIRLLKENQIEPIVTLLHFDTPPGLVNAYGGWLSRRAIDDFVRYAKTIFVYFGKDVTYWLTINEQNIMSISANMLGLDKNDTQLTWKLQQCNYHMYLANAKVITLCHEMLPKALIGPAVSYPTMYPASPDPDDILCAKLAEDLIGWAPMDIYVYGKYPVWYQNFLKKKGIVLQTMPEDDALLQAGRPDFLGINWYCTSTIKAGANDAGSRFGFAHSVDNPYLTKTLWGWTYDPKGFYYALRRCYERYHLPLLVTENGWSSKDELEAEQVHDEKRCAFLSDHIEYMQKAIADGVEMLGYCVWSFVDLLSSGDGFEKRYGLVYVDRTADDFHRYKKDSFYTYQKLIQTYRDKQQK